MLPFLNIKEFLLADLNMLIQHNPQNDTLSKYTQGSEPQTSSLPPPQSSRAVEARPQGVWILLASFPGHEKWAAWYSVGVLINKYTKANVVASLSSLGPRYNTHVLHVDLKRSTFWHIEMFHSSKGAIWTLLTYFSGHADDSAWGWSTSAWRTNLFTLKWIFHAIVINHTKKHNTGEVIRIIYRVRFTEITRFPRFRQMVRMRTKTPATCTIFSQPGNEARRLPVVLAGHDLWDSQTQ